MSTLFTRGYHRTNLTRLTDVVVNRERLGMGTEGGGKEYDIFKRAISRGRIDEE
ncbi:hypothetical protein TrRE_jg3429, partial [Triparma retinervis]